MGCCVSKNGSRKQTDLTEEEEEFKYVQDKPVISHYPKRVSPISFPNRENLIPIPDNVVHNPARAPLSPSKTKSFSSTLTSTASNNTISSWNSSASSFSSTYSAKDRSFSNEFLQACYRENPHIVRINSIREASLSLATAPKPPSPQRLPSPARPILPPSLPDLSVSKPKFGKNDSPSFTTLLRQRSFRKEQERVIGPPCSLQGGRSFRSPSPSRRFGKSGSKVNPIDYLSLSTRQESHRQVNPMKIIDSSISEPSLRNRETRIHRISSKINENVVKEVVSGQNEYVPMEDLKNPLISLDCFIFL